MTGTQSGSRSDSAHLHQDEGSAGVTVYVLLSGPAWVGPRIALAADLVTLNSTQAKAMLAMARQLFPHDKFGDEYYWVVGIDRQGHGSLARLATRILTGLAKLNEVAGGDFTALDADKQIAAMNKSEAMYLISEAGT